MLKFWRHHGSPRNACKYSQTEAVEPIKSLETSSFLAASLKVYVNGETEVRLH